MTNVTAISTPELEALVDHITAVSLDIHDRIGRLEKAYKIAKSDDYKKVLITEISFFNYLNTSLYAIQNTLRQSADARTKDHATV